MNVSVIETAMTALALERPVFHSEADLQHALAWQLQTAHPSAHIRLETRPIPGMRLDAMVVLNGLRVAIELKYLARNLSATVRNEAFELPYQAAQDVRRYDFVKDIARVERLLAESAADAGFAIALTNDRGYWNNSNYPSPADGAFRLSEGRLITGTLAWAAHTGAGTMRGRESPIDLAGSYELRWRDFSQVDGQRNGTFRYLVVRVGSDA